MLDLARPDPAEVPGVVGVAESGRRTGMIRIDPRRTGQVRPTVLGEQIGQAEGEIVQVGAELTSDRLQNSRLAVGARQAGGQLAQRTQAPLADHPIRLLGDGAEDPFDLAVVADQRAVGEGMIGLLGIAVALQEQHQGSVPGRLALLVDGRQSALDVVPDLRPQLACGHGQGSRMLDAQRRPVGVVVEEVDVRTPAQPHFEPGGQQQAKRDLQSVGPCLRRTHGRGRPVVGAHDPRHLPVAHEDVGVSLGISGCYARHADLSGWRRGI